MPVSEQNKVGKLQIRLRPWLQHNRYTGRFTATEQIYHFPTSVWFQNERILGEGCHYCGSTRS